MNLFDNLGINSAKSRLKFHQSRLNNVTDGFKGLQLTYKEVEEKLWFSLESFDIEKTGCNSYIYLVNKRIAKKEKIIEFLSNELLNNGESICLNELLKKIGIETSQNIYNQEFVKISKKEFVEKMAMHKAVNNF